MWTPRKTLLVAAHHHMKANRLSPFVAIEEIVQDWQQKKINQSAVDYYLFASPAAVKRLINQVGKENFK